MKYQVTLSEKQLRYLDEIMVAFDADNRSDAIRKSLSLAQYLAAVIKNGGKVAIMDADGNTEILRFV